MQGDFITLRKVKSKLLKLRLKDKDDGDEAEDLPEDTDKESYHTRIKQKLIALREKLGEEIKEDRELTRVKIKQKIIKLTEKLLKERDEEENGRGEESVMDGSEECSDEEEGEGEENETEGEGGVRKSMSVALMNKICKLTEKLGKYDDRCSKVEQPSGSIGEKKETESTQQEGEEREEEEEEEEEKQETTPSDGEGKSIKIKKKLMKIVDELEEKKTRKGKVKIICDLLRIDDGGGDKDSLCSEDEKEGIRLKKMKKLFVKNEKLNCESSDTERNESENPSGSGSQSKLETTELCSSEMKILEKLSQRFKERSDKVQRYFQRSGKLAEVNRRLKSQIWSSVVTIVLVEGKNLVQGDNERPCDSYCKFRLGNEKYKSKVVYKSPSPSWLDQFDFHLYDDQAQELEVSVWHKEKPKDEFLGRCVIDLTLLEREKTHGIWQNLEEGGGSIHLLLTISGTTASETISDLSSYDENPAEREKIERRYALKNTLHNLRDVGHLTVKVFRATGLAAADLGGKSDPFCVLELVNARLQTQTEYKTLSPSWQKIFTFNVKDINAVLEVTVFDEDRDHKVEFLGKVAIPLLRIKNGEKKWYCLKDKKLQGRAKGNCPMILLEMCVVWNPVRACIRTLNPKEEKYMQAEMKFKRQVFIRNVVRLKGIIMVVFNWGKQIQDLFEWERPAQSAMALIFFIILCYYFEPYMIPMGFLLVFFKYYLVMWLTGGKSTGGGSVSCGVSGVSGTSSMSGACGSASGCCGSSTGDDEEELSAAEEEEDDDEKDKLTLQEEKKSLKERLQAIQDVTQTVQNSIGYMASLGEQVKNTFNFTVPFISYLAIALSVGAVVIMYFIPLRYLIMIAGVNKFARKLLRPHTIPNNEVLDLLSRVPDDVDLVSYREFRPYTSSELEKRRELRKKLKMG